MSKRVHRFPLFSITASIHIKGTSALMLSRGLIQQRTLVSCRRLHFLFISSLPQHTPPLSLPLSLVSNSLWLP
ncbi:unnamed protein product [Hymenolepis diminuta]|uniref:Uncharacterized protein n=1 Tax=Hymenolepis diminuta TaxID=6216 RepID=A0A564YTA0_HYMDI|nr:unnamed protein product [Hymenolepis diminuta]